MSPAPKFSPQQQEALILDAATQCINETSIMDFTMSAVAKASGLSMGSIYKHVQCKEDIYFALAVNMFSRHRQIFSQVLSLELTTPEKILAIALLGPCQMQVYPFDFELESIVTNEAIIRQASPRWTERMVENCHACERLFYQSTGQAITNDELIVEPGDSTTIDDINTGMWAMIEGFRYIGRIIQLGDIARGTDSLHQAAAIDSPLIKNLYRLLNSYQWRQPLSPECISKLSNLLIELELR